MTNLGLLIIIGALTACGVYLMLERNLTRMVLGLLLVGNAVNLLILTVGGPSGNPPIIGRESAGRTSMADPLAQGMILTAIVITMGVAAFTLALIYRMFTLEADDVVDDDAEDARVAQEPLEPVTDGREEHHEAPESGDEDSPSELDALPAGEKL
ncbi:Na(+)/H(+) antiporter subunit C [Mycobacteroides chelonae]|jgi:multicomponent Na+:H+ antiporter subunit C|uniref:Na(+)/H(+) antiporter subunit C n=1 Tax=Mycobacteroides TaxID=670516 RepID=UPI0007152CB1|nr:MULTISPECIES: Na(+)/H(+) antiporter subunit C [Mycobacteroides]PKQ59124.1 Na(+)/H(+) antiporter subunit C [Mycobacterium sp. MHSD3]SKL57008.1 NADH-ubiquinone oxidoreductase, chain 4L precursor [Mycobacteroides abscessus subsp. bolletii]KRQ21796.1 cation:proton antiporter [Mycobacteroides sp. H003]KRQ36157.1 cation:proton antiporter [Mycobacteroides sp. H101]KRQ37112.1 cation:proton antiporter [Mycobacteroides sp. H092]